MVKTNQISTNQFDLNGFGATVGGSLSKSSLFGGFDVGVSQDLYYSETKSVGYEFGKDLKWDIWRVQNYENYRKINKKWLFSG